MDETTTPFGGSPGARRISRRLIMKGLFASTMTACSYEQTGIKAVRSVSARNVTRLSWSLDNKWIAASSEPASYVGVWRVSDGKQLWTREINPPTRTLGIAFVNGSKQLAAACYPGDGTDLACACLISADSGGVVGRLTDLLKISSQGALPTFISASADQSKLAVGFTTEDRLAVISFGASPTFKWLGPLISRYQRPVRIVQLVALSPGGSKLAASFAPGEVQVVDVESRKVTCKILPYKRSSVSSLCFTDEHTLLIASDNTPLIDLGLVHGNGDYLVPPEDRSTEPLRRCGPIQVWDVEAGLLTGSLKTYDDSGIGEGIGVSALTTDGTTVIAYYRSGYLQRWRFSDGLTTPPQSLSGANPLAVSGDARYGLHAQELAVASSSKILFIPSVRLPIL